MLRLGLGYAFQYNTILLDMPEFLQNYVKTIQKVDQITCNFLNNVFKSVVFEINAHLRCYVMLFLNVQLL